MPAVLVWCAGCGKELTTYLNVIGDVFGKYSRVLIHGRESEERVLSDAPTGTQPDYYCIACWKSTE